MYFKFILFAAQRRDKVKRSVQYNIEPCSQGTDQGTLTEGEGRFSTVDLLVLTGFDQLLLMMQMYLTIAIYNHYLRS